MSAKTFLKVGITLSILLMTVGLAEAQILRSSFVVDSIPAPAIRFHVSVCFDSSGRFRVLHNVPYQVWTDTLIFRIDTADGRVLDSLSIRWPNSENGPWGMAFAYNKFWIAAGRFDRTYIYKIDTLGVILGQFLAPIVPPASGNGICFEGDKLWITSALDSNWVSGVYQTDTLGNVLKFVRIDNSAIGVPSYLAFWPRVPKTLFVSTWRKELCQITTEDTVAALVTKWPSPFPPPDNGIHGSTFDSQGYFWANCTDYPWILKLDLGLTGVERNDQPVPLFPKELNLHFPGPSPTSSKAVIRFEVPSTSRVKLTLVNIAGSRVRVLNDGVMRPGEHRVVWDGRNDQGQRVPSGVYFFRLEVGKTALTRKMVVIR